MISTDLLRERAAKAQPTSTALGRRGLARVRPQGSLALLTWKGCRCRPPRAGSPKCHPNGNKRASALCIAGRWVRAALPSPAFVEHLRRAVLRGWGDVSGDGLFGKQPFAVAELMAALKATESSGAASLGVAEPTTALVGSVLGGKEVPLSLCLCPPCGTRFLYALLLGLSLKTQTQVDR